MNNFDKLLLKNLGVEALILFGSQTQGIASETSDYDFYIIGTKGAKVYNALYDLLSKKIGRLVDIDIVFDEEAPMELKNHVAKYGEVLYQKNLSIFADFRQDVMINYADFAPYRKMFSDATLARIE